MKGSVALSLHLGLLGYGLMLFLLFLMLMDLLEFHAEQNNRQWLKYTHKHDILLHI